MQGQGEREKAKAERFENLLVWQKAMDLVSRIYEQCQRGRVSKDWSLRDQLQRAAVSVPANIAEGYERGSRKEYVHFLTIAKGSIGEVRCLLLVSERLRYFDEATSLALINDAVEISRMLMGLLKSLKS